MAILNDNEFTEFEGRSYLNPQVSLDESNTFIDNLRETQQANNQQIQTDTRNLGTDIPSNLGGLTGADSYFTSRYQVPQTNSAVADLKAAAQATALNEALANEEAMWKKRYQDAYRDYQKRAWNKSNTTGGGGGGTEGGLEYEDTGEEQVTVGENEVSLEEPRTTDVGAVSAMNAYTGVTGGGQIPTSSSIPGILVDKNGNRTAITVYPGEGIEVAGGMSYNREGAKKFLSDWVKNGGQVLNYLGGGNYSTNVLLTWDLG